MEQLINALPSLLKKQQELDDYIMRERFLTHDETIKERKLAFVVELAELAQEWRGFKYWSDNQEPSDKVLEEYVDVLHFALSLHNYYKGDTGANDVVGMLKKSGVIENDDTSRVTIEFLNTINWTTDWDWRNSIGLLQVVTLSKYINLDADDILKEYDRKYQINIERQNNGY